MGILGSCHQIGSAVNDISPSSGSIEGFEGLFVQHYFDSRGFSRLELLRLYISCKFHGRDFHPILFRILGIRLLNIELYDFFTCPVPGIEDIYGDLIAFLSLFHCHVLQFEFCVGHAVSERKGDFPVIVEGTSGGCPQNRVFIAGLIITVPDIYPLGIYKIAVAELHITVSDPVIAQICCCRSVQTVIDKSIRKSSGRIDASADHLCHSCHPVYAKRAGPKAPVDPVFLHKPHLHGIFGVEHHDHLLKVLLHISQQFPLLLRQL